MNFEIQREFYQLKSREKIVRYVRAQKQISSNIVAIYFQTNFTYLNHFPYLDTVSHIIVQNAVVHYILLYNTVHNRTSQQGDVQYSTIIRSSDAPQQKNYL